VTAGARPSANGFSEIVIRCFLPFAAGYFLSYLFRSVNAVIGPYLVVELQLDASALGLLTAAYFAAFAAFQIPLGILLDRYGPRRVESALLISAAIGAVVFAVSESVAALAIGRAMIGLGVSACLMASLKANTQFWPRERLPLANGCLMAFGGLGATVATLPVHFMLGLVGWRAIFLILVALTLLSAAYIRLAVPERTHSQPSHLIDQIKTVGTIYRSPVFWRVVPVTVFAQSAFLAYQGLWAGPWLRDIHGFEPDVAAGVLFDMSAAMIPGFVLSGAVYDWLRRIGLAPLTVIAAMMGFFIATQLLLVIDILPSSVFPVTVAWALFCIGGTFSVVTFAYLNQVFPHELAGRVNTALNVLVFSSAFAVQAGVGRVIDLFATDAGGFAPLGHKVALLSVMLLQVVGYAWMLAPRAIRAESGASDRPAAD
jgi:predicted MFS family arabinose efflux permease